MRLVQVLRLRGVCFVHVPNNHASANLATRAKAMGLQPGFPDLLILDAPPGVPESTCPKCRRPDGWASDCADHEGGCMCDACTSSCWDGDDCTAVSPSGVAIELKTIAARPKTARAGRFSGARPNQREWLERLEARGWVVFVAYGCDDAIGKLREMGYRV